MTMNECTALLHDENDDENTMEIVSCLGGIDQISNEYIRITQQNEKKQLLNPQQMEQITQVISTAPRPLDGDEQKDDEKKESTNILSNTSHHDVTNAIPSSSNEDTSTDLGSLQGDNAVISTMAQNVMPEIEEKVSTSNMQSKLQSIHRICYCQRELIEDDDMDEDKGWICRSCCRRINESVNFWCNGGDKCIYQKISALTYVVCSECFNMEIDTGSDRKETELVHEESIQNTLIIDKLEASLKKIKTPVDSYVDEDEDQSLDVSTNKAYLWTVYHYIYTDFLKNLHMVLGSEQHQNLMEKFNAIYDGALHRIQNNLDLDQLELTVNALPTTGSLNGKENGRDVGKKDVELYRETATEWQTLMAKERDAPSEFVRTAKDGALERTRFVMGKYREHFLKQMVYRNDDDDIDDEPSSSSQKAIYVDLFAECLSEYDAVSLLNDFEHIRQHPADTEELRDCKLSGPLNVCCGGLVRECRESEDENVRKITMNDDRSEFEQFVESLDDRRRVLIEITSNIHMFINHSIQRQMEQEVKDDNEERGDDDSVWRLRRSESYRRRNGSAQNSVSKFVNEMKDWKPNTDKTKMDDLPSILLRRHLSRSDTVSFIKYLETEHMDSDAVNEDLSVVLKQKTERELVLDSNLFPMLQNDVLNAKNVLFHLNELRPFRFGCSQFYHWKYFQRIDPHSYIQSPKYSNLKEECLQNNIYKISRRSFAITLELAQTLWRTNKGRSLKAADNGGTNHDFEIPPHSPISISHICVLLMYCNFTILQNKYKKNGCRESTDVQSVRDQAFIDLKEMNREIAWWYRLINESVEFWGQRVSVNDVFYTGLDCKMTFDNTAPQWNCPFSTTVCGLVALNFATEQGIILEMKPSTGSTDRYFDCEWLSGYPEEAERLFVSAANLQITDIRTFDFEERLWTSNKQYIECLSLFSSLFEGHFVSKQLEMMKGNVEWDKVLLSIFNRYQSANSTDGALDDIEDIGMSLYIEQLSYKFMQKFAKKPEIDDHFVIKSQILLLPKRLQRHLGLFDGENMRISPFLESLSCSLNNVVLMTEYIWNIADEEMGKLKEMAAGHEMWSDEYVFDGRNSETVRFRMGMDRKTSGSQFARFAIKIDDNPYSRIKGRFSVGIDEVDWELNAMAVDTNENSYCGFLAFADELFDDAISFQIKLAVDFWDIE